MIVLTGVPLFGEVRTIKLPGDSEDITLDGEGKRKLEALNKPLIDSKIQITYSS